MRNTAFLAVGVAPARRAGEPLPRSIGHAATSPGVTPSLLLPLIVFMGVHEYSLVRGAALAFVLGYLLDLFAAAPDRALHVHHGRDLRRSRAPPASASRRRRCSRKLALAFVVRARRRACSSSCCSAIFGGDAARPARARARSSLPHAIATALFAPLVFRLAERVAPGDDHACRGPEEGARDEPPRPALATSASSASASAGWRSSMVAASSSASSARLFQLQVARGATSTARSRARTSSVASRSRRRAASSATAAARSSRRAGPSYNVYVVPARLDMQDDVAASSSTTSALGVDERARLEQQLARRSARDDGPAQDAADPAQGGHLARRGGDARDARGRAARRRRRRRCRCATTRTSELGAHVLGYMAEVDAETLAQLRSAGYVEGDRIGATGVERAWESYLRGTRGWEKVRRRRARARTAPEAARASSTSRARVDPIPGRDLRLTLDIELAAGDRARRCAASSPGGVVVVDVRTGRLLGALLEAELRPERALGRRGQAGHPRRVPPALLAIRSSPLLDKTIVGRLPAGLDVQAVHGARRARGRAHRSAQRDAVRRLPHASASASSAAPTCTARSTCTRRSSQSCNVYFYQLAAEYGVGMDVIAEMAQRLRARRRRPASASTPRRAGRMPTRAWMTLRNKGQFRIGFTLNTAIGQGATTVTRAPARARVRRARERRHALPAAARARGRDERRHGRAGVRAARAPADRRAPREPRARAEGALRRA